MRELYERRWFRYEEHCLRRKNKKGPRSESPNPQTATCEARGKEVFFTIASRSLNSQSKGL